MSEATNSEMRDLTDELPDELTDEEMDAVSGGGWLSNLLSKAAPVLSHIPGVDG